MLIRIAGLVSITTISTLDQGCLWLTTSDLVGVGSMWSSRWIGA